MFLKIQLVRLSRLCLPVVRRAEHPEQELPPTYGGRSLRSVLPPSPPTLCSRRLGLSKLNERLAHSRPGQKLCTHLGHRLRQVAGGPEF